MSHYSRSQRPESELLDELYPASTHSLRVGFIHPDLGIGGAERLIVDAAVGLQKLGHDVEIFTSWHQADRCFDETRDGTLKVHVLGNSIFPRTIAGRFHTLLAIFRQLHLAASLVFSVFLYYISGLPLLSSYIIPPDRPFASPQDWSLRRSVKPYDVFFVDQLSACVPALRWGSRTRVVFYCHFPDLLLSKTRGEHDEGEKESTLKQLYRMPLDWVEETTTGQADKILVNSEYTSGIFQKTFPGLHRIPRCVYPGVDVTQYEQTGLLGALQGITSDRPTVLSINRFEDKKDIGLAIETFALLRKSHPEVDVVTNARLVLVGGYDPRLADNVRTLFRLQKVASDAGLTWHAWDPKAPAPKTKSDAPGARTPLIFTNPPSAPVDILFLPNVSSSAKLHLLRAPSTKVLIYTPSNEHLGIVPLEAMASGVPVLCTDTGGPRETVIDAGLQPGYESYGGAEGTGTGLLRPAVPALWASALYTLLTLSPAQSAALATAGRTRAKETFSLDVMARRLEGAIRETHDLKRQKKRPDLWAEDALWKMIMVITPPVVAFLMLSYAFFTDREGFRRAFGF